MIGRECPIQHVFVSTTQKDHKTFACSFKVVPNERYWLDAQEIAERCKIHQQKVPYIVAAQLYDSMAYQLGDALLKIEVKPKSKHTRVSYLCGLESWLPPWIVPTYKP